MDTRKIATEIRMRQWSEAMRVRKASGMTVRSWCQENGCKEKTYYYWQRKLREAACEHLEAAAQSEEKSLADLEAAAQSEEKSLAVPGFAKVAIEEEPAPVSPPSPSGLRIEVGSVSITADATYPPAKLAELLRELSQC